MPELVIAEWSNYYRTIIAQRYQSLFSHLHRAPELVKFPRSSWWSSCSFSSIAPFSASWGWTWDRGALSGRYPLVMTNIAIENGHRNNWCTRIHSKWWFSIVYVSLPEGNEWVMMSMFLQSGDEDRRWATISLLDPTKLGLRFVDRIKIAQPSVHHKIGIHHQRTNAANKT